MCTSQRPLIGLMMPHDGACNTDGHHIDPRAPHMRAVTSPGRPLAHKAQQRFTQTHASIIDRYQVQHECVVIIMVQCKHKYIWTSVKEENKARPSTKSTHLCSQPQNSLSLKKKKTKQSKLA
ncbi:hypothetical protein NL108_009514 [Boleophthalmus pectinirostris]|nr:hypothetical protein NL108_009514 [Boleophthalmus pectinirostris]